MGSPMEGVLSALGLAGGPAQRSDVVAIKHVTRIMDVLRSDSQNERGNERAEGTTRSGKTMATGSSDNASWLPLSSGMPWLESPLLLPRRVSEIRLDGRDAIMEFPTRSKRERDAKKRRSEERLRRRAGRNETTTIGAGSATSGAGSTVGSKKERPILSETALDLVVSADCESALAYYASAAQWVGKHWGKASAVPPPPAPLPPQQPGR